MRVIKQDEGGREQQGKRKGYYFLKDGEGRLLCDTWLSSQSPFQLNLQLPHTHSAAMDWQRAASTHKTVGMGSPGKKGDSKGCDSPATGQSSQVRRMATIEQSPKESVPVTQELKEDTLTIWQLPAFKRLLNASY